METVVYNSIKDYLSYLPYFYKYMWLGLGVFASSGPEGLHPYASCVWPLYMTKRFGDLDLMRQIWQICGQSPGYNTLPATNTVLGNHGSNLSSAFLEFETWNFQTGPLADTINGFTDGRRFPAAETTLYLDNLTINSPFTIPAVAHPPQLLATNYIVVNSPGAQGGIIVDFNGQDVSGSQSWRVALLGYRTNDSRPVDIEVNPTSGIGGGAWPGWSTYRAIILIPTVSSQNPSNSAYTYTGTITYDSTLNGGEGTPGFGIAQAYPSPYIISSGDLLTIPYSLDKFYSKSDLGLFIFDASGGLVREIPSEYFLFTDPGQYHRGIQWDGRNPNGDFVASGIYIILFKAGSNAVTGKIAVVNNTR